MNNRSGVKNLKSTFCILAFIPLMCFIFLPLTALAQQELEADKNMLKYLLEVEASYDYLIPYDSYGSWTGGLVSFYAKLMPTMTAFAQVGGFLREKEGNGLLGSIGAYKDWVKFFSTYSAVAVGSRSSYLPLFGIYHEFNWSIGPVLLTLPGIQYIDYHDKHTELALYGGFALYFGKWIIEYKFFRNENDPGDVVSYSHLANAGYYSEGWFITSIMLVLGQQAYLVTHLATPEEIRENAYEITLRHKHWLGTRWGLLGSLSYAELGDEYDKYGASLGAFIEW